MSLQIITEKIKTLPQNPGVYKFYNNNGKLLYIGKAKNLKKRISSYFINNQQHNNKTTIMVNQIADIQFTIVETETDALLLENALIKEHQPKYNINLKDDKTYPYIIIKNERFPRIFYTRHFLKDGSEYFGPYASGTIMHTVLDTIKSVFKLRTCNYVLSPENIKAAKFKVCLEYHIGNCGGPCTGIQSEESYTQDLVQIKNILKGNLGTVTQFLKEQMQQAASNLAFEEAALYKQKIDLLKNYQSKSTIANSLANDVDVFSIVSDNKFAFVNYLKVSNGLIIQTQTFELKKKIEETETDLLEYAITAIREQFNSTSKEIILPFEPNWHYEDLTITIPKAGEKKKLLDLSLKNAMYFKKEKINQYEKLNPEVRTERILTQMQHDLRLKTLPRHIECFDNSNLQGTNPVSACVVFKNTKPSKADYRIFNVKTVVGPNDFATMEEVIYRRYFRILEENTPLPDLIIIDGGKGQLSSAISSLKKLHLYGKIPVIGIAKRLEELYYPDDELPLYIDKKSETLKIIQQLRDEAHRFGITAHRKRREKSTLQTELEHIKGIGPETAALLLRKLKSVKKIKAANFKELAEIIGAAKAELIINYYKEV